MDNSDQLLLSNILANCDRPLYSSGKHLEATGFLCLHLLGMMVHFLVLPATVTVAKKRSAFSILLNINIMHLCIMLWAIEMYVGYFVGHRIVIPLDLDAFLLQVCTMAIAVAYNLLALNRIIAIMAPILYCRIFTFRRTRIYIAFCWLVGIIYSLILNVKPHLRIHICISTLGSVYPPSIMKNDDDFHLQLITVVGLINLITTSYTPTVLYAICLCWMMGKKIKKVVFRANAISDNQHHHHHHQQQQQQQVAPPPTFSPPADNYSYERMRLYAICILGTMPPFALTVFTMTYLYSSDKTSQFDPPFVVTFTMLYAIFHTQQPLVMLVLSRELRAAMCKGIGKIWRKICPNNGHNELIIMNVKNSKIAWSP